MNRRGWVVDGGIAAGVVVVGQLEVWLGLGATHRQGPAWAQAVTYAVGGLLLAWRRVHPIEVLAGIVLTSVIDSLAVGAP